MRWELTALSIEGVYRDDRFVFLKALSSVHRDAKKRGHMGKLGFFLENSSPIACNFPEIFVIFSLIFQTLHDFFHAESLKPGSQVCGVSTVILGLGMPSKEETPVSSFFFFLICFNLKILWLPYFQVKRTCLPSCYEMEYNIFSMTHRTLQTGLSLCMRGGHLPTCLLGNLPHFPRPQTFQWQ